VFLKKTSESTTCSWLHCFLIEHVEKTWKNMEKNGSRYFSGQYIEDCDLWYVVILHFRRWKPWKLGQKRILINSTMTDVICFLVLQPNSTGCIKKRRPYQSNAGLLRSRCVIYWLGLLTDDTIINGAILLTFIGNIIGPMLEQVTKYRCIETMSWPAGRVVNTLDLQS
jgi:hypothetical protein